MVPLAIGVGLGAAGQVANYVGGRKEAKRRDAALGEYRDSSTQIYEDLARDAWDQGSERQRGTGKVLENLSATMGTPGTAAPKTSDFLPTAPSGRGDVYDNILQTAMQPRAGVDQADLDATQAGLDRNQLSRLLDALGFSSTIEAQSDDPEHKRVQFTKQRELEEARARLEAVLGSVGNSSRNLQMLGSLLGTAGQASMMYGAMGGAGPTAAAPGVAGAVSPSAASVAPTSIYSYLQ
jgi:hypothetical protein